MTRLVSHTLQMDDVACNATLQAQVRDKTEGKPDALCTPIFARLSP